MPHKTSFLEQIAALREQLAAAANAPDQVKDRSGKEHDAQYSQSENKNFAKMREKGIIEAARKEALAAAFPIHNKGGQRQNRPIKGEKIWIGRDCTAKGTARMIRRSGSKEDRVLAFCPLEHSASTECAVA